MGICHRCAFLTKYNNKLLNMREWAKKKYYIKWNELFLLYESNVDCNACDCRVIYNIVWAEKSRWLQIHCSSLESNSDTWWGGMMCVTFSSLSSSFSSREKSFSPYSKVPITPVWQSPEQIGGTKRPSHGLPPFCDDYCSSEQTIRKQISIYTRSQELGNGYLCPG